MTRIAYLEEQIVRAERLAGSILDTLTTERLQAYAAECRLQVAALRQAASPLPVQSWPTRNGSVHSHRESAA